MTTSNPVLPSLTESLEQLVAAAQASGNFKPLWMRFVKTRFYVSIVRHATESATGFDLWLSEHPVSALTSIHVSEQREQLPSTEKTEIVAMSGADIVRRAPSGAGISLMLSERTLDVASARVEWLRQSLQASLEAARQKQMAATQTQEFATPSKPLAIVEPNVPKAPEVAKIPTPAPVIGVTDIAALKPRFVEHAALGIEIFVPEKWQEVRNDKALKFVDRVSNAIVEVSSLKRDNMRLEDWMAQRLPRVTQEMPCLTQSGDGYPVHGAEWRGEILATATEYRGRFQDDEEESIYLICCYRTNTRVAAICIRAKASVFEAQRGVYRWMLGQINIKEFVDIPKTERAVKSTQIGLDGSELAPPLFALSYSGRLGRLRFIAYSFLAVIPAIILSVLGATLGKSVQIPIVIIALILVIVMQLRPTVLRLHDLNLSGKWVLLIFILPVLGSLMQKTELMMYNQILMGVGSIALWLMPGRTEHNNFGPPCPPNSTLIKLSAAIFILLMVVGLSTYRTQKNSPFTSLEKVTATGKSGYGFSPDDKSFVVNFPSSPRFTIIPNESGKAAGMSDIKSYEANSGKHNYLVQRMDFNVVPSDKSMILDKLSDGVLQASRGTLVSEEKIRINGLAARSARVKLANGNYQDYRILFAKASLYILAVETKSGKEDTPEVTTFFDSFEVN